MHSHAPENLCTWCILDQTNTLHCTHLMIFVLDKFKRGITIQLMACTSPTSIDWVIIFHGWTTNDIHQLCIPKIEHWAVQWHSKKTNLVLSSALERMEWITDCMLLQSLFPSSCRSIWLTACGRNKHCLCMKMSQCSSPTYTAVWGPNVHFPYLKKCPIKLHCPLVLKEEPFLS